jgi:hypothetical protein
MSVTFPLYCVVSHGEESAASTQKSDESTKDNVACALVASRGHQHHHFKTNRLYSCVEKQVGVLNNGHNESNCVF